MFKQFLEKKQGVSFLEVMIVVAILAIMSSIVIASLGRGKVNKILEEESRKVAAAIKEAQNDALAGKNAASGCEFTFSYTSGGNGYGISGCVSSAYRLENQVVFAGSGTPFSFRVPHGKIFSGGTELGASEVIDVSITLSSTTYHVCVFGTGRVETRGANSC